MTSDAALPEGISALLERIDASWDELEALITSTDPSLLVREAARGWTAKDHLAQITAWEQVIVALIQGWPMHEALELEAEIDVFAEPQLVRDLTYERFVDENLASVFVTLEVTHAALTDAIVEMTDADLERPFLPGDATERRSKREGIIDYTCGQYEATVSLIRALVESPG
jgi:hypothetical protein